LGLACGRGFAWLFKEGKPIKRVSEEEMSKPCWRRY
jgi:(E)-4-hydroxy-3-methylbut-2-enyl-diphosphate synthase